MYQVKVEWISARDGGRKAPPPAGRYFAVSRFPEDKEWQNNAWSVVFELTATLMPADKNDSFVSEGSVRFLVENAPHERMKKSSCFDIYEGPKKVAKVFLLSRV
ncbi:hypothetical protein HF650_10990 [Kosakonia sp. SMBL-WEM22]|uniref:hypothetical protein n=1 Tax=Kosakonia sp. SMBL-WEM22 TaxID=2725560 RepID=UPI001658CE9E|nr:hypothetical protein [Kosakonia sp. SMBL-WEM22]QNQ20248.1 hypothetical protein HF650_10990 [Kosakonia sp. SMBL-WEM22]